MNSEAQHITVLGGGLAGSLMTILLARRGIPVHLVERRPDMRSHPLTGGRSINLALADRGLHALKVAGMYKAVAPLLIPMSGRMLHDVDGKTQFVAYGQRKHEVIYSVSRNGLTQLLLNHASQLSNVSMQFESECVDVDFENREITLTQHSTTAAISYQQLIAADGYRSVIRRRLLQDPRADARDDLLPHGYKELTLPAGSNGQHQLRPDALHIWPRGGFMLIALPNTDGTFTMTLFLPFESSDNGPSFSRLCDKTTIAAFFEQYFPDVSALMPNIASEFLTHPTGKMHTIRSSIWTNGGNALLIGDAAHAIVPFHGQGMNCAFEDCIELDQLLKQHSFAEAAILFAGQRKPNTDAIADMALENYIEMRETVRHPRFLLQKELSFELERRFPDRFIPRYSMVMFHHSIPYAVAYERGKIQTGILDELTANVSSVDDVDMTAANILVNTRLGPLR